MIKKLLTPRIIDLSILFGNLCLYLFLDLDPRIGLTATFSLLTLYNIGTKHRKSLHNTRLVLLTAVLFQNGSEDILVKTALMVLIIESIVYFWITGKFSGVFSGNNIPDDAIKRLIKRSTILVFAIEPLLFLLSLYLLLFHALSFIISVALLIALNLSLLVMGYRWKHGHNPIENAIKEYLEDEYRPTFLLYFSAPAGSTYQVAMWIEYLESLSAPLYILIREASHAKRLRKMTTVPIVCCKYMKHLESYLPTTLKAVFYVNNGMKNVHITRIIRLLHIQLLHGDSDKASSYNPMGGIYDKIFVSGQAGIDRYRDHGIIIPEEKFVIIGRPQVKGLHVVNKQQESVKTVLYLTTWPGFYQDVAFCSLPIAENIIQPLLASGYRVLFKPHPYTYQFNEAKEYAVRIKELLGDDYIEPDSAESLKTFYNISDCLISDISSVMNEYLYTEKPIISTNINDLSTSELLAVSNTIDASYILDKTGGNITQIMDEIVHTDPKRAKRKEFKTYYLSDITSPDENFPNVVDSLLAEYHDNTKIP